MNIAFTGTFRLDGEHVTRAVLEAVAQDHGHTVEKSITERTQILVVGDTGRHGNTSKIRKAEANGVVLITPEEFLAKLKETV